MRPDSVSCPAPSSTPKYPLQSRLVPGKKYSFHLKTCMKEAESPSRVCVCVCERAGTVYNHFFHVGLYVWWGIVGPIQDHLTQTPKGHCPQVAPIQGGLGCYHRFCPNSVSSRGWAGVQKMDWEALQVVCHNNSFNTYFINILCIFTFIIISVL